jgi:four helix bundle protein
MLRDSRAIFRYQLSLEMVVDIHAFCKTLPSKERFVLAAQMGRASRSICAAIAEAWRNRRYKAALISELNDAEAEASEMKCWLDVARQLAYMSKEMQQQFDARYEHLLAQLVSMINNADRWCSLP